MDNNARLHYYNFVTRALVSEIFLKVGLCSVSFSQNSSEVLVNKTNGQTILVDIDSESVIKTYDGYRDEEREKVVIRSTFGGANENFVVSGTRGEHTCILGDSVPEVANVLEDGTVYIWHKENSQLIETLKGHAKGCCNAVSWNPRDPGMFASAGDDGNIRM